MLLDGDKKKRQQDYGLLSFMNEDEDEDENVSPYTDDELDDYGLSEYEKEEVKKGYQEPWDFDEEDLEDDDYYNEDD